MSWEPTMWQRKWCYDERSVDGRERKGGYRVIPKSSVPFPEGSLPWDLLGLRDMARKLGPTFNSFEAGVWVHDGACLLALLYGMGW